MKHATRGALIVLLWHACFLLCSLSNFGIFRAGRLEGKVINAVNWVGRQPIYFRDERWIKTCQGYSEVVIYSWINCMKTAIIAQSGFDLFELWWIFGENSSRQARRRIQIGGQQKCHLTFYWFFLRHEDDMLGRFWPSGVLVPRCADIILPWLIVTPQIVKTS